MKTYLAKIINQHGVIHEETIEVEEWEITKAMHALNTTDESKAAHAAAVSKANPIREEKGGHWIDAKEIKS